ncbi:MAG: hypothetical protein ACREEP_14300 [Dongiaceae bacterium]
MGYFMRDIGKIVEIVKKTLAADFAKMKILDVKIREELDSDGEDLLRVYVIFEGAPKDVDVRKLSGAVRHLRPKLSEMGETAFPLFSFISRGDVGAEKFEPA